MLLCHMNSRGKRPKRKEGKEIASGGFELKVSFVKVYLFINFINPMVKWLAPLAHI